MCAHVSKSLGVWSESESDLVEGNVSDGISGPFEYMFAFGMFPQLKPWVGVQQPRNQRHLNSRFIRALFKAFI